MKLTASSLERVALCPGSYFAEKGLKSVQHPAAKEGELLHSAMAKQVALNELNREQGRLVRLCTELGRELKQRTFGEPAPGMANVAPGIVSMERFISWRCSTGVISTKLDYVTVHENKALVIDWKFGFGAVEPSEVNLQLRAYALAVAQEWPDVTEVHVAIIQPYADREHRVSVCVYGVEDLVTAAIQLGGILELLRIAETVGLPPRYPGEAQCKYCKALGTERCPESTETAKALAVISPSEIMPVGADLAAILNQCGVVMNVVEAIREHAKAELAAGREVPGWKLRDGNNVRTLPDPQEAWSVMGDYMSAESFMSACKVTVGALEDAYAAASGLTGKSLREDFNAKMRGTIKMRLDAPRLEKAS